MTTIDSAKKHTLINPFKVDPEQHAILPENLRTATEKLMSKLPGYFCKPS